MKRFVNLIAISTIAHLACAQASWNQLIPIKSELSLNTNFHWNLEESISKNEWDLISQARLNGIITWSKYLTFNIVNEISFNKGQRVENEWRVFQLQYRRNIPTKKWPIFKYGIRVDAKAGWLEWRPKLTNIQMIFDNADAYFNPSRFWGMSLYAVIPFTKDRALKLNIRGHSGDLFGKTIEQNIQDVYINYQKTLKNKLGVSAQMGLAQGNQHFVNFAYFSYAPKWEDVKLTFKLGKLPARDETPYGVHFRISRTFKYIALGGYYERRLNQQTIEQIAGFSWRIVGPPKLLKIFSTFRLSFNFNTNTVLSNVPLFKVKVNHK